MASGAEKLATQIERLPLDSALKTAVLKGVAHTDDVTAERHAASLRAVLDGLPERLENVRAARARARHRNVQVVAASGLWNDEPQHVATSSVCTHCGQPMPARGLEAFLGRLGLTSEIVDNLERSFQNVDLEEYMNSARTFLKDGSASTYAKENPGKVAAGVAALALGAGLIYAAVNRDRDVESSPADDKLPADDQAAPADAEPDHTIER